jgi:hypothetical protein
MGSHDTRSQGHRDATTGLVPVERMVNQLQRAPPSIPNWKQKNTSARLIKRPLRLGSLCNSMTKQLFLSLAATLASHADFTLSADWSAPVPV